MFNFTRHQGKDKQKPKCDATKNFPECLEYKIDPLIIGYNINQLAFSYTAGASIHGYNYFGKLFGNI